MRLDGLRGSGIACSATITFTLTALKNSRIELLNRAIGVAQASSPASLQGVPPRALSERRDAARTRSRDGCATGFMGSFDLQQWTRIGAMNRFDVAPAGCKMCFYKFLAYNQMTKL